MCFSLFLLCLLNVAYTRDPGEVFFKEDVQILLERLTGCDFDKVFRKRKLGTKLQTPTYELLTEDEVNKLMEETRLKAKYRLKMPPLLKEREPIKKVLARNPELQGFDNCTYLFTDISQGISDRVSFFLDMKVFLNRMCIICLFSFSESCYCGKRP